MRLAQWVCRKYRKPTLRQSPGDRRSRNASAHRKGGSRLRLSRTGCPWLAHFSGRLPTAVCQSNPPPSCPLRPASFLRSKDRARYDPWVPGPREHSPCVCSDLRDLERTQLLSPPRSCPRGPRPASETAFDLIFWNSHVPPLIRNVVVRITTSGL